MKTEENIFNERRNDRKTNYRIEKEKSKLLAKG